MGYLDENGTNSILKHQNNAIAEMQNMEKILSVRDLVKSSSSNTLVSYSAYPDKYLTPIIEITKSTTGGNYISPIYSLIILNGYLKHKTNYDEVPISEMLIFSSSGKSDATNGFYYEPFNDDTSNRTSIIFKEFNINKSMFGRVQITLAPVRMMKKSSSFVLSTLGAIDISNYYNLNFDLYGIRFPNILTPIEEV